jgi:hypothetical protein
VGIARLAPALLALPIAFPISPLKATTAMNMASAITSAIDHRDDSSTKNLTIRLWRSKGGLNRHAADARSFNAGRMTLNINTRITTAHISGRLVSISTRNTSNTLLLWKYTTCWENMIGSSPAPSSVTTAEHYRLRSPMVSAASQHHA